MYAFPANWTKSKRQDYQINISGVESPQSKMDSDKLSHSGKLDEQRNLNNLHSPINRKRSQNEKGSFQSYDRSLSNS